MVFVPLQHVSGPVQHAVPPLGQAAGNIPAGFYHTQLLPAAVAFQIGLVHHVDAVFIAQVVPAALVGVMAGAYRINVVAPEGLDGGSHVGFGDSTAPLGVPFVPVDAVEHDALAV